MPQNKHVKGDDYEIKLQNKHNIWHFKLKLQNKFNLYFMTEKNRLTFERC